MCGSMAAEPLLIPLLIGMGLRTLSMAPTLIPSVKTMIRNISCMEAEEITRAAFEKDTATEVEDLVRLRMKRRLKI
jgi:phosphotransferase system enzyme I (PtsI)